MSKWSVKFVPALFAGVVAGTSLATVTDLRAQVAGKATDQAAELQVAQATDSCLSAPKGATPAGSHWYYRIDRATKRQCWYLREESEKADDKFARAAPPAAAAAPASAPAPSPSDESQTQTKFAEARAEYVSRQSRTDAARADSQSVGAMPAPTSQDNQRAAMPNVLAPAPLANVRWNDSPAASASTNSAGLQMAAAAAAPAEQQPQAEEVQQGAVDQVAPVAAEPAKPTASLQMLFLVMVAALALAGLTVSAIVRIGRMRARRAMRRKRRAMWDSARTKRAPQPALREDGAKLRRAVAAQPARAPQERTFHERTVQDRPFQDRPLQDRTRVPRERPRTTPERSFAPPDRRQVPQDRERERQVTEMLSRLARSAQT
ncbi:hypothetical protein J6524_00600 [Bradyrhizobium sp. WSM 1738]|uniref:hypothetical protein n=1 Tax=Bradyrhizobium hereditatis TaxID=2821405 RepID=UPI001CE24EF8|nr:hypothetical protein [Bradyrhizobium hereditatis]MCA6113432.1 hypothetical protein [Bradyrhizobium hereditatis]